MSDSPWQRKEKAGCGLRKFVLLNHPKPWTLNLGATFRLSSASSFLQLCSLVRVFPCLGCQSACWGLGFRVWEGWEDPVSSEP